MSTVARTLRTLAACAAFLAPAAWAGCGERYYAPDDNDNQHPLARPHKDFLQLRQAAQKGGAAPRRSLAAAYEAGYLVERCAAKAIYWYRQAADAGDDIARVWTDHHEASARQFDGPECAGDRCFGGDGRMVRTAVFYAGPNGHYFAPVSINGVTQTGLIDTGASNVAMSEEMARKFGIASLPAEDGRAMTAAGIISQRTVLVPTLSVSGITVQDVKVSIGIASGILIGMNFLNRVNVRMEGGSLSLTR